MQVTCDGCKKALRIPDTAAGKKVRCPMCQTVFTALPLMEIEPSAPATAITTPPPSPRPEPFDTPSAPPAARRRPRDDDYDDDEEPRIERSDRAHSRQQEYLRSGAFWLLLSGVYFVVNVTFNILSLFLILPAQAALGANQNKPGYMVGMVCGACLWFIPAIFILLGSFQMRSARSRGLVITGVVFDFIMCAVMLVGLMCNVVSLGAIPGRLAIVIIIQIFLAAGGVTLGMIAGIKTLMLLGKPEVKEAFGIRTYRARDYDDDEEDDEWERRRRRRRRDGGED